MGRRMGSAVSAPDGAEVTRRPAPSEALSNPLQPSMRPPGCPKQLHQGRFY